MVIKMTQVAVPGLAIAAALMLYGCSQQTIESATRDTAKNIQVVEREAREAERKARPHVAKLKPQVQKLNLASRVTVALKANENLPGTIRVDGDVKGVRLRGSVKTQAQKSLAGRIARDTLGDDKTVRNELEVKSDE